jgi:cell division protein FtsQ
MLLSRIKKILSSLSPLSDNKRKNKRGNGYLNKKEMDLQAFPVPSRHQSSQYTQRKIRLARFRQLLTAEKRVKHGRYTGAAVRKKNVFKVAGLATVTVSLLLFILIGGGQKILNNLESSPFFHVSGIVISGTENISQEKLREASGIILHQTSLIGLNCSQVEASLVTVPWVARALVKRNWPSTVEISIVENVPVALLHSKNSNGNQLQYIDKKGIPFHLVKPGADVDFPVITGLTEISEPLVKEKALAEVLVFLKSVSGNNPYLPAQSISEIHLDQDGEMVVYLVENPFPIFFGNSNTDKKYVRLVQVLKALYKKQKGKGSISQIEYIQMDYLNDKVLVAQNESG